ncbi:MAG: hypothetical protein K6B75_08035 [Lachnospiraceae bacterium]|nr:hypothetical protein [Lachnospiraceae bacterium]
MYKVIALFFSLTGFLLVVETRLFIGVAIMEYENEKMKTDALLYAESSARITYAEEYGVSEETAAALAEDVYKAAYLAYTGKSFIPGESIPDKNRSFENLKEEVFRK